MKKNKFSTIIGFAAAALLCSCQKRTCSVPLIQYIPAGTDIRQLRKAVSESVPEESSPEAGFLQDASEISSGPSDILTRIQLEAGADEISSSCLFREYNGQHVTFLSNLSAEQLAAAGSSWEIDVLYDRQPFTITVEIIDTTPPSMEGISPLCMEAGGSLSYKKGIILSDNASGEITLEFDNSQVNPNVPGVYPLYYTATDAFGNQSRAETTVTVNEAAPLQEETVNALADELIARLVAPEMNRFDTAYALWNWCRTNIRYTASTAVYNSVWEGAFQGLNQKSGDCYIYYATFSLLLDRCGIENLCVRRSGGVSDHWWNLVNIGDGWYHCDSSPRRRGDPYLCFMQTDAQVHAYTESYPDIPGYYSFDGSLYPERESAVIFGDEPQASTAPEQ